jgi:hypothetical protein
MESPACLYSASLTNQSYVMQTLNELEKAVLEQILRWASGNQLRLLKEQIEGASVISRKNTGAGFFYKVKGQTSLKAY